MGFHVHWFLIDRESEFHTIPTFAAASVGRGLQKHPIIDSTRLSILMGDSLCSSLVLRRLKRVQVGLPIDRACNAALFDDEMLAWIFSMQKQRYLKLV